MSIYPKLLEIQKRVDRFLKDGENTSDKYRFVSSENVLETIRPAMNELGLLLLPITTGARIREGQTRSGTTRYFTELDKLFVWVDAESGEKLEIPFYAQGVDLAGEKGVGKAETYAEKYFLMKFFHVPTGRDDPDNDGRTGSGEKRVRGTQAAKETAQAQRKAIAGMLCELCGGDAEKMAQALIVYTKNENRGYAGVREVEQISAAALPVVYAKIKETYGKRTGGAVWVDTEE